MHATGQLVSRFRAVVAPLKPGAGARLDRREQGGILPPCSGQPGVHRAVLSYPPPGYGRHAGSVPRPFFPPYPHPAQLKTAGGTLDRREQGGKMPPCSRQSLL